MLEAEQVRAAAEEHRASAARAEAEAQEKAAQARREQALAARGNADADEAMGQARAHHDEARSVDPDVSDTGEDEARELELERDANPAGRGASRD